MTVRKKQLEKEHSLSPMEIGVIQMVQVVGNMEPHEEEIQSEIENKVFEIVEKTSKEYKEIIINPQFHDQKIKIWKKMTMGQRG